MCLKGAPALCFWDELGRLRHVGLWLPGQGGDAGTFLSSRGRSEQLKGGCGYTGSWCTSLNDGTKMRCEPELLCQKKHQNSKENECS